MENDDLIPELQFNRNLPFYPLVVNYLAAIQGVYELTARYMIANTQETLDDHDLVPSSVTPETPQTDELIASFYAHPQNRVETRTVTEARLRFTFHEGRAPIDPRVIAAEVGSGAALTLPWLIRTAGGSMLISAWAVSSEFHELSPEWEFLRHSRNAAAHGGRFTFLGKEPVREARWRNLSIKREMKGTPLFKGLDEGLLWPGDPVHLLWDLEHLMSGKDQVSPT